MAYTLEQLEDLEKAIALGALSVRKRDGSKIDYRSGEEMETLRRKMRASLGLDNTGVEFHRFTTSKDLE